MRPRPVDVTIVEALAIVLLSLALPARGARAQTMVESEPEPAPVEVAIRPRMSVAVGMGASLDDDGFMPARTRAVPAFFAMAGAGDGMAGFALQAFASQASGRYRPPDAPVDRLALDAMLVVRALANQFPAGVLAYRDRVLRSIALEIGVGLEREGRATMSGSRFGLHTGGHFELPLAPAGRPTELRVRLGVRHFNGVYVPRVGDTQIGDTTELYGALAVAF